MGVILQDAASHVKPARWLRLFFNTTSGKQHQDDLKDRLAALEAENSRLRLVKQITQQAQSPAGLTAVEFYFINNKLR